MQLKVTAKVIEWRGPAPFYFLPITDEDARLISEAAKLVSYGWGVVPVSAELAGKSWQTSLIPRQGSYLLPLKDEIRRPLGIETGEELIVTLIVAV